MVISQFQARQHIPEKELEELKNSIKAQGVFQPLIVRKKGIGYEIIAGSRRYIACKSLGINKLPVIIKDLDDKQALIFSIMENLQRQDLNSIEEAKSFKRLIDEFGFSHEAIAEQLGKDRSTITNALRLLNLPQVIQRAVIDEKITKSEARTLLGIKDEAEMLNLFENILTNKIPVNILERTIRGKKRARVPDLYVANIEKALREKLGRKVTVVFRGKRGRIVLEYYSPEDLENLLKTLGVQEA